MHLIIFDSTQHDQRVAALQAQFYINKTFQNTGITFKDIHGITSSNISVYIATLTAGSIQSLFVLTSITGAGGTSIMSYDQIGSLNAYMQTASQGTVLYSGTCAANSTVTNIVLPTGASTKDNFYKGCYIITAGATVNVKQITAYAGATLICTVTTTGVAVTTTDTFIIFQPSVYMFLSGNTTAEGLDYITANTQNILRGIVSGVCASNSTATHIVLGGTVNAVTDQFKGCWILTNGTTVVARQITGYNATTQVCTVATTTTAVTTTETYKIITQQTYDYLTGAMGIVANIWWNCCKPSDIVGGIPAGLPKFLSSVCASGSGVYGKTIAGGAATAVAGNGSTITLAATQLTGSVATAANIATNSYFNNMYICVINATTGANQIAQIASYVGSTQVATLTAAFPTPPTGTVKYRIYANSADCFTDEYARLYAQSSLIDVTSSTNKVLFANLLEIQGGESDETADSMLLQGQAIFTALINALALL